jgi:NAD(P)-dependent dehydrogenase (short-subunit alcohol dehydrogenase family)
MRGLKDKGVLISGGKSGIGLATAKRFLEEGSRVFVCGHAEKELTQTLETLNPLGSIAGCGCDVSKEDDVKNLVMQAQTFLGDINVLINNAGIAWTEEFLSITLGNWRKILDVNLQGMFLVSREVAKTMVARGQGGAIVLMASTNGLAGEKLYAHYNASKGGVVLLMQTMALELGQYDIRVNALCPGYIQSPLTESIDDTEFVSAYISDKIPLGRTGKTEDVAAAYAFLASDDARFIHGTTLVIDGGQLSQ